MLNLFKFFHLFFTIYLSFMNRKNNKENLRTIVLNAPKIKLKLKYL